MNISAIDKIYNYLSGQVDYVGLPETEAARKKVKAYLMGNILSTDDEEAHKQQRNQLLLHLGNSYALQKLRSGGLIQWTSQ